MTRRSPHLKLNGEPKRGYRSRASADRERQLIISTTGAPEATLMVYRCPVCQEFHVGREYRTDRNRTHRGNYKGAWS